jgi:transcriptional regulator with XRE-family HTH domain
VAQRNPRNGGRKRPPDAELIIEQVRKEFKTKKKELGATEAARQIGVRRASFYNYLKGKTVPDLEVLRRAHEEWDIEWKHIDFSEVMKRQQVRTVKQLAFEFLDAVREDDIQVIKVAREGNNLLRVALKIRFSA